MFAALGRTVYRLRRPVAAGALGIALLIGSLALGVTRELSAGGWSVADSEAARVSARLATDFGSGGSQLYAVFSGGPGSDARSSAFQAAVTRGLVDVRADALVVSTTGYAELPDERFISTDGRAALVVIDLAVPSSEAADDVDRLRRLIRPSDGVDVQVTGLPAIAHDAAVVSERDLVRAELVSLPLALLILVTVFASLTAAAMPLLVAGLAIPTTLGLVALLAQVTEMSLFVLNVATMLGLALAIDYSLFIVSRFREELASGRSTAEAVERTVASSGKAVVFSAGAVAIGLSGLLLFEAAALTSMGVAGIIVVAVSAVYAVTFLPAVLGMLGPRVNALSVAPLYGRLGLGTRLLGPSTAGRPAPGWARLARWVMAHPVAVLVPTLALLLVLGMPFLQVRQAVPDATVYREGMESRDAFIDLQERFTPGLTSPLVVLADVAGEPTSGPIIHALAAYAEGLRALEGVVAVDSYFTGLPDPLGSDHLTVDQVVVLYEEPNLRALARPLLDRYVRGSTVRLDVSTPYLTSAPEAASLVERVRTFDPGPGIETTLGGAHASGQAFIDSMAQRVPWVALTVIAGMLIALFLLFGSVVLPIKAVLLTLLSVVASFGALVWIFQLGHLEAVLGFEAPGYTVAGTPIVMFAVLFGLSMDYSVLLLTRIQESHRLLGDNTEAVADGLARTAGVITGAAAIMVVVFAAFALADVITVKALGVGLAIAVFLDATVVRVLLVPATMRLLGEWNWWAPGPLRRLAERIGLSEVETVGGRWTSQTEGAGAERASAGHRAADT